MIIITAMLLIGVVAVGLMLMLALRKWTVAEMRLEDRLRSPGTPTVSYVVPAGQDPVVVMTALAREGFVSVPEIHDGTESLLVECAEADRTRLQRTLERTGAPGRTMGT